jgi:amino acid transporter
LANAFIGYFNEFFVLDRNLVIIGITLILGSIAAWGITESLIIAGLVSLAQIPDNWDKLIPPLDFTAWGGMFAGTLLAFYAFIGFEDMVNVAEEVKDVKRTLPLAILITIGITTILYLIIMLVAILALPADVLASSQAPLALLFEHYTGRDAVLISIIGMFAIINGSLIQMIMASRVIYGLSSSGQLPGFLSKISPITRTPINATVLVTFLIMFLALIGELATLAEITSLILLLVFSIVNLALWRIKKREPEPAEAMLFPAFIPLLAFVTSSGFVFYKLWSLAGF